MSPNWAGPTLFRPSPQCKFDDLHVVFVDRAVHCVHDELGKIVDINALLFDKRHLERLSHSRLEPPKPSGFILLDVDARTRAEELHLNDELRFLLEEERSG